MPQKGILKRRVKKSIHDTHRQSAVLRSSDFYFNGIESIEDVIFSFKSSDVTIQDSLELPISIPTESSSVLRYKFSSLYGDIEFGILFEDLEDNVSVLTDIELLDSEGKIVEGELRISKSGCVYLIWENSFSWVTKQLSYSVELHVNAFSAAESQMTSTALDTIRKLGYSNKVIKFETKRLEKIHRQLSSDMDSISKKIVELEAELLQKKASATLYLQEVQRDVDNYVILKDTRNSLFIRCLSKELLLEVFKFIPFKSVACVCKYWKLLTIEAASYVHRFTAVHRQLSSPGDLKEKKSEEDSIGAVHQVEPRGHRHRTLSDSRPRNRYESTASPIQNNGIKFIGFPSSAGRNHSTINDSTTSKSGRIKKILLRAEMPQLTS